MTEITELVRKMTAALHNLEAAHPRHPRHVGDILGEILMFRDRP
jgi:hypothetical protein